MSTAVRLADHRLWPVIEENDRTAVMDVLSRGVFSAAHAPETRQLESAFADYVGANHCLMTHSGTAALQLAVGGVGIEEGDEVIVPAYSFVATPMSVLLQGGIPVFADIDPESCNVDPAEVARWITPRTRALMPVHVHGCPANLEALTALAARHDLALIEDAAQAHGATYNGKPVGTFGQASGFSLQSSKNLGVGEGGLFVTNDQAIAERAHQIRSFGQSVRLSDADAYSLERPLDGTRPTASLRPGAMFRGNEMSAALARSVLTRYPEQLRRAQTNASLLSEMVQNCEGLKPTAVATGTTSAHHKFRVLIDFAEAGLDLPRSDWRRFRQVLMEALRGKGLEAVLWETEPLPAQPLFSERQGFGKGWPWSQGDQAFLAENYRVESHPKTQAMLDSSFLLFSQSYPLIAQEQDLVERYGELLNETWSERHELAKSLN